MSATLATILLVCCTGCDSRSESEKTHEHVQAGNQFLAEGRIEPAIAEFEEAVRLDPEAFEAHVQLANIAVMRGQVGYAEARFNALLELDPENPVVLAGWGKLLAATGRLEQAVPVLRSAAEAGDPPLGAAIDLARVLSALGREEEALSAYENAARLGASDSTSFLVSWADTLSRNGRGDESIQWLEKAASMAPDDPQILGALGQAYLESSRTEEAVNILQRAVAGTDPASSNYEARSGALQEALAALPRGVANPGMPNVLLVVIDTLRADHVGAYGYPFPTTPNLDRFAERSIIFETAVSQAPWTAPAIASLFTGLYPSVHGLDGGIRWGEAATSHGRVLPFAIQKTLPPGHQTLAEVFRSAGYTTAGFVSNLYVNAIFGFAQGFDHFDDSHDDYLLADGETKRRAAVTNERVFEWLLSGITEPFFLVVHYNDPHWPYEPPPPYGQNFITGYQGPLTPTTTREIVVTHREAPPPITEEDLAYIVGLYDGEIQYVDTHLGRLLDAVNELPTDRELVTVVTADHGEEFLDHGAFNHGYTLYEEQTSVPFIISEPSRFIPRRVAQQVRLIDAAPTILDLAGIDSRQFLFQGRSLVPLMAGSRFESLAAFSEATNVGGQSSIRSSESLKLIHSLFDPQWQLFDLRVDPGEQRDLRSSHAAQLHNLAASLESWREANQALRSEFNVSGTGLDHVVLDEKTKQGLQALGYINP
jgi:arylsulfatase A-like enzyme/Flp pilus assembly protein TadD